MNITNIDWMEVAESISMAAEAKRKANEPFTTHDLEAAGVKNLIEQTLRKDSRTS